jgi:hypothetical protein
MSDLIIFGENHTEPSEIIQIQNEIRKIKPDFILLELMYEDEVWDRKDAKKRLDNCKEGELCDPRLNVDWYELAYELNIPCIGIDLDEKKIKVLSKKQSFEKREKHMVDIITDYLITGTVVVVVGDSHLRTTETEELGKPSLIQTVFSNDAKIIRSKYPEIE